MITYGWEGFILDKDGADIAGCSTKYEVHPYEEDFGINCDAIKNKVIVHNADGGVLEFTYGDQKWNTDNIDKCTTQFMPEYPSVSFILSYLLAKNLY